MFMKPSKNITTSKNEEKEEIELRESLNEILKNKKGIIFMVSPDKFVHFHKKGVDNPETILISVAEFLEQNLKLEHAEVVSVIKFIDRLYHEKHKLKPE